MGEMGSHEVAGKNTRQVVTLLYGPIDDVDSPKVAKSVDKITTIITTITTIIVMWQLTAQYNFLLTASRAN